MAALTRSRPAAALLAVLLVAFLGVLLWAAPARADPVARWRPYIAEASQRFGVPPEWIARVMRAESGGRTHLDGRPITSPAGAMGLMQLMPGTWAELRAAHGLGADPHDPRANILAGAAYLRAMFDRFGYPGLFAAYNAGPARYAAYLEQGRPLPAETRAYLRTVTRSVSRRVETLPSEPADTIFAVRKRHAEAAPRTAPRSSPGETLFVPLSEN